MTEAVRDIYGAVQRDDARGLARARERVRRVAHKDLLARWVPGLLGVIDGLEQTPVRCDATRGGAASRGLCLLRRGRFEDALLAFAEVPRRAGGPAYRDITVRLLAEHRRQRAVMGSPTR